MIRERTLQEIRIYLRPGDPLEILKGFNRFKILCALREGPYGVVAVNRWVEQTLRERGLIEIQERWYRGRPIMITSNDYELDLFNGDVGIVLPDPDACGDLRVFFPGDAGSLRRFHPVRLPEHETVYAMTVHKSQGSEFDEVFLILSDRESPVLTRELLYTGISRAKDRIHLWAPEAVLKTALSKRVERTSGLRDRLWGDGPAENGGT
jgi:exodeoxyribonuclease V alpha subunit